MALQTVVVVAEEPWTREPWALALTKSGHRVLLARDPHAALAAMTDRVDVAIVDGVRPGALPLAEHLQRNYPKTVVLVISEAHDADSSPAQALVSGRLSRAAFLSGSASAFLELALENARWRHQSVGASAAELPLSGINLEHLEQTLVLQALERTGWNQTQAARLLGLNRDQIHYRIEKYRLIAPPRPRASHN